MPQIRAYLWGLYPGGSKEKHPTSGAKGRVSQSARPAAAARNRLDRILPGAAAPNPRDGARIASNYQIDFEEPRFLSLAKIIQTMYPIGWPLGA